MGTSRFPSGKPDILMKKWGMTFSGSGTQFLNFPVDEKTGVWALTYRSDQPRERIKGDEAVQRKDEIMKEVSERGSMYHEPFNQFIEATDPLTLQVFSAMHKSPINHAQKLPQANVIFIGDANHPMSPFSGNGANMALLDAVVLAKELSSCASIRAAIETFDADSMPRSQKSIDRSRIVIALLHARGIAFFALRLVLGVLNFCLKFRSS
jgi:2-polyprenyl-6-methoxyphenol hydroxylase-like FAD-dependent oxidoreductase